MEAQDPGAPYGMADCARGLRCISVRHVGNLQRSAAALVGRFPALPIASAVEWIMGLGMVLGQAKIIEDFHALHDREVREFEDW